MFAFPREQHDYVPKLSEFLDDNVDEKYYIPDEKAQKIIQQALEKLQELGKVHATITPDRLNKRQNGPRAKEDEKEMFTLTAQDIHGVIVQRPRGKNAGGVHEIAPTLTSHAYQQNNFVVENTTATEADVCAETGLLDPNGCGKTLRVGGGELFDEKAQLPAHFGEEIDTLHGVLADPSQAKREGKYRIYDNVSPTIAARDYKEPRLVIVKRSENNEQSRTTGYYGNRNA